MKHWLDKYIKKEKYNKKILGKNSAELQEISDREGWENKHRVNIRKEEKKTIKKMHKLFT